MASTDTLVTGLLVYASIGSLIWLALYCTGAIGEAYRRRFHTRPHPMIAVTLASVGVVVAWPIVFWVFFHAVVEGRRG